MSDPDVEIDLTLNRMVALTKNSPAPMTYESIGDVCGLSKQAVHQIELRALRKLANNNWHLRKEWFDYEKLLTVEEERELNEQDTN